MVVVVAVVMIVIVVLVVSLQEDWDFKKIFKPATAREVHNAKTQLLYNKLIFEIIPGDPYKTICKGHNVIVSRLTVRAPRAVWQHVPRGSAILH